jgi:hypothetical protein
MSNERKHHAAGCRHAGNIEERTLSLVDQFQAQIDILSTILRVILFCRRS